MKFEELSFVFLNARQNLLSSDLFTYFSTINMVCWLMKRLLEEWHNIFAKFVDGLYELISHE